MIGFIISRNVNILLRAWAKSNLISTYIHVLHSDIFRLNCHWIGRETYPFSIFCEYSRVLLSSGFVGSYVLNILPHQHLSLSVFYAAFLCGTTVLIKIVLHFYQKPDFSRRLVSNIHPTAHTQICPAVQIRHLVLPVGLIYTKIEHQSCWPHCG